jgi:glycosyltransferase involved in cell wall biosynthesis
MSGRSLHIAWIGFAPAEEAGGVPGVATDLLHGLATLGHRIDCFFPARKHELPPHITDVDNLTPVWGTGAWRWNRWYSRTKFTSFVSSHIDRSVASLRLRREVARRHRREPYDLIYQFANVENLAVPRRMQGTVPLVVHPETSSAGELEFLIKERELSFRCQPIYVFAAAVVVLWLRKHVQRRKIRGARLVVCISSVFRDHLIRDYGLSRRATVVVPNSVRADRFEVTDRPPGSPPIVMVLGRIAARKGVDDVVAIARLLLERNVDVNFRIVGGTSLWSNYAKLLEDLPPENTKYVGRVSSTQVPAELAGSDVLLQASKYEPFALTVGEALAAGVPVVATTEVGAIEGVDGSVGAAMGPGDVEGMATAITTMIDRLKADPTGMRAMARAEAQRLFAPEVVCEQISAALERLVDGVRLGAAAVDVASPPVSDRLVQASS